jgi:hypothetical protein
MSSDGVMTGVVDQLPKLFPTGFSPSVDVGHTLSVQPKVVELAPHTPLASYAKDYVLFTPALVYTVLSWPVDPWVVFMAEMGIDEPPTLLVHNRPLLLNVPPFWAHHIQLLPREWGETALQYFGTLALNDSKQNVLYRVRAQEIEVQEPHCVDGFKYAKVHASVVESTMGSHYFIQKMCITGGMSPRYVYNEEMIFGDTLHFRDALKAANNPYGSNDAH